MAPGAAGTRQLHLRIPTCLQLPRNDRACKWGNPCPPSPGPLGNPGERILHLSLACGAAWIPEDAEGCGFFLGGLGNAYCEIVSEASLSFSAPLSDTDANPRPEACLLTRPKLMSPERSSLVSLQPAVLCAETQRLLPSSLLCLQGPGPPEYGLCLLVLGTETKCSEGSFLRRRNSDTVWLSPLMS